MAQGDQFGRKGTLFVTNQGTPFGTPTFSGPSSSTATSVDIGELSSAAQVTPSGIDLSQLRFKFSIRAADVQTPNTAIIRVYNLSQQTINTIIQEYTNVVVQAGYEEGNFGVIFSGSIKQFQRGKEQNIDNFLEIRAADGDEAYNFGFANTVLPMGSTYEQRFALMCKQLGLPQDPSSTEYLAKEAATFGGVLPYGKVLFGLYRDYLRDLATSVNARFSIQNGVATLIPLAGYLPNQVVVINSSTGMIGVPEATDNGIEVRCLLNPLIKIGTRVQINNGDITQTTIKSQFFPNYTSITYVADTSNDGFYRVMVAEHEGDTRGGPWYTSLICLNVDPSSSPNEAVLPYG